MPSPATGRRGIPRVPTRCSPCCRRPPGVGSCTYRHAGRRDLPRPTGRDSTSMPADTLRCALPSARTRGTSSATALQTSARSPEMLDAMRGSLPPGSTSLCTSAMSTTAAPVQPGDVTKAISTGWTPPPLHEQLIPHLVSRVIYAGAGGFDSTSSGLTFLLSPRVAHIFRVSSDQSTGRPRDHSHEGRITGRPPLSPSPPDLAAKASAPRPPCG